MSSCQTTLQRSRHRCAQGVQQYFGRRVARWMTSVGRTLSLLQTRPTCVYNACVSMPNTSADTCIAELARGKGSRQLSRLHTTRAKLELAAQVSSPLGMPLEIQNLTPSHEQRWPLGAWQVLAEKSWNVPSRNLATKMVLQPANGPQLQVTHYEGFSKSRAARRVGPSLPGHTVGLLAAARSTALNATTAPSKSPNQPVTVIPKRAAPTNNGMQAPQPPPKQQVLRILTGVSWASAPGAGDGLAAAGGPANAMPARPLAPTTLARTRTLPFENASSSLSKTP